MVFEHIEKLKAQYTDKYVIVDDSRPELRRFRGLTGLVKTVNMSGRALVQFEGPVIAWFDIDPAFLKIVDAPVEKPKPAEHAKPAEKAEKPAAKAEPKPTAEKPAAASGRPVSTADILAMARGQKPSAGAAPATAAPTASASAAAATPTAKPAAEGAPTGRVDAKKLSTAEILAMARGQKPAATASTPPAAPAGTQSTAAAPAPSAPASTSRVDPSKLSTAEILALARGQKPAAAPAATASSSAVSETPTPAPTAANVAQLLEAARRPKAQASAAPTASSPSAPQPVAAQPAEAQPASDQPPPAEPTSPAGATTSARDKVKSIEEILAYCRRVDSKK